MLNNNCQTGSLILIYKADKFNALSLYIIIKYSNFTQAVNKILKLIHQK